VPDLELDKPDAWQAGGLSVTALEFARLARLTCAAFNIRLATYT
jgi:hypothetical protein